MQTPESFEPGHLDVDRLGLGGWAVVWVRQNCGVFSTWN